MIIGHSKALEVLPDPLPSVTLLLGPPGIGKSLVARDLGAKTGAQKVDLQVLSSFQVADADAMIEHHKRRPYQSPCRTTVADITNATPQAINSALKILEEPPETSRMILHSDRTPLLTVLSRSFRVQMGPLHDDEISYLLQVRGVSEADADALAQEAHGSMEVAMRNSLMAESYAAVTTLCSALGARDGRALNSAISSALKSKKGDGPSIIEAKRRERCFALADAVSSSIRGSFEHPALSQVSGAARLKCLDVLSGRSRPTLRYRSAAWNLAVGYGR